MEKGIEHARRGGSLASLSILAGTQAVSLWAPTLLKKLGYAIMTIGFLATIPSFAAIAGILLVARSSDRRQERRWHFALSMFAAGLALACLSLVSANVFPNAGIAGHRRG